MSEENKKVVLEYVEAFNRRDEAALRRLFTEDALIYGVLGWGEIEKVVPIWRELWSGLDIQLHVEGVVAEGDTVAVRYTERGTFVGAFFGHEPTGRTFELVAMEWFELQGGRIRRRWGARDSASQARQAGIPLG
ncbi:MAG TPA: ester cyclase [Pyrinomonadaceae bacterium]|nr:ester cyclase [Pyrinomonadaceae bacterium]